MQSGIIIIIIITCGRKEQLSVIFKKHTSQGSCLGRCKILQDNQLKPLLSQCGGWCVQKKELHEKTPTVLLWLV